MPVTLKTAPTSEPLTVSDVKAHANIDTTDDDALLTTYIIAAREHVEDKINRTLITQTWDYYLDRFHNVMEMPKAPLQSVSAITYVDTDGATQTLSTSIYTVDSDSDPGRVVLAYNQSWPSVRADINVVKITFISGYGNAAAVAQAIKHAMLLLVSHWYESRESASQINLTNIPSGVDSLLSPYRIVPF